VQLALEQSITGFCQQNLRVHVAGRTDAGVHARGQVAHFDLDYGDRVLRPYDLIKALNAHLRAHRVAVVNAVPVGDDFHARFSAVNKLYTYRIVNRSAPPALDHGKVWHIKKNLNAKAMHDAAQVLLGHHDFTTFRDSDCQAKSPMKTLNRLDVEAVSYDPHGGVEIRIHAEARSFLHHQVRNMTGALALVGEGKWTKDDLRTALNACDRTKGGPTAPPEGLYLMRIDYA
jgi:tRNA pseudouridine38-40 synthase